MSASAVDVSRVEKRQSRMRFRAGICGSSIARDTVVTRLPISRISRAGHDDHTIRRVFSVTVAPSTDSERREAV